MNRLLIFMMKKYYDYYYYYISASFVELKVINYLNCLNFFTCFYSMILIGKVIDDSYEILQINLSSLDSQFIHELMNIIEDCK